MTTVILTDTETKTPLQASDAAFWDGLEDADLFGAISAAVKAGQPLVAKKEVRFKKRGNIKGLGKHLANKYGPTDEGFFTRCMGASELASYDEEVRKEICARAHKEQIGKWPGEKKHKECTTCRRVRIIRRKR